MDETVFGAMSAVIGLLGLLWRRDLLGVFLSLQILNSALACVFLRVDSTGAQRMTTELAAVFVLLGLSTLLCVGLAIAVRLFYKKMGTGVHSVLDEAKR